MTKFQTLFVGDPPYFCWQDKVSRQCSGNLSSLKLSGDAAQLAFSIGHAAHGAGEASTQFPTFPRVSFVSLSDSESR